MPHVIIRRTSGEDEYLRKRDSWSTDWTLILDDAHIYPNEKAAKRSSDCLYDGYHQKDLSIDCKIVRVKILIARSYHR